MGDASTAVENGGAAQAANDNLNQLSEFADRDLSWLEFNRRVLHEAVDERTPLLERVMFLGIFTSNLDEFFMKRVGRLTRQRPAIHSPPHADGSPHAQWLTAIREAVVPMLEDQARCFRDAILPALKDSGIHLLAWAEMTEEEHKIANRYFRKNVFPVVTPQVVDSSGRVGQTSRVPGRIDRPLRRTAKYQMGKRLGGRGRACHLRSDGSQNAHEDRQHRERLWEILHASLEDRRQAWEMQPDDSYRQRQPDDQTPREAALGTQSLLMERTPRSGQPVP